MPVNFTGRSHTIDKIINVFLIVYLPYSIWRATIHITDGNWTWLGINLFFFAFMILIFHQRYITMWEWFKARYLMKTNTNERYR